MFVSLLIILYLFNKMKRFHQAISSEKFDQTIVFFYLIDIMKL